MQDTTRATLPPETPFFEPSRKRFQAPALSSVLSLDAEGSIVTATAGARTLLEYREQDAFEPCFFAHVHVKNLYQVMRDVADMVCYGKKRASWLMRLRTARHGWRWVRASVQNNLSDGHTITVELSPIQPAIS